MQLRCMACGRVYAADQARARCDCGGLLDVELELGSIDSSVFDQRLLAMRGVERSGVWRYRELLPPLPAHTIVSQPEGNTNSRGLLGRIEQVCARLRAGWGKCGLLCAVHAGSVARPAVGFMVASSAVFV